MGRKIKDLLGQKFSFLRPVVFNPTTKKWICQCDCENILEVSTSDLTLGRIKSCGCKRYIRKNNMQGQCPKLIQVYNHIKQESKENVTKEWKDFNTFKEWALDEGWMELLHYKKVTRKKLYSKDNLIFGIKYNYTFLPIKEAKKHHIYFNKEENSFLIRFRYNDTTVKKEQITSIQELCEEHIKLYRRYFHKKSIFS